MGDNKTALFGVCLSMSVVSILFLTVAATSAGQDYDRIETVPWYYYDQRFEQDNGDDTKDYKRKFYFGIDALLVEASGDGADDDKHNVITYYDCATDNDDDDTGLSIGGNDPTVGQDACGACWGVAKMTLGFLLLALMSAIAIFVIAFLRFFDTVEDSKIKPFAIAFPLIGFVSSFISMGSNMDSCRIMVDQMLEDMRDLDDDAWTDNSKRDNTVVMFPIYGIVFSGIFMLVCHLVTLFVSNVSKAPSLARDRETA